MKYALIVVAGVLALPGCATSAPRDVPAVIVDPTPQSRAELSLAVQRALHSDPIPLADDALTRTSLLPIDRMLRRDSHGRLLNGMEIGRKPEIFKLVKRGNACVLIHDDLAQLRQTLAATRCRRAPKER